MSTIRIPAASTINTQNHQGNWNSNQGTSQSRQLRPPNYPRIPNHTSTLPSNQQARLPASSSAGVAVRSRWPSQTPARPATWRPPQQQAKIFRPPLVQSSLLPHLNHPKYPGVSQNTDGDFRAVNVPRNQHSGYQYPAPSNQSINKLVVGPNQSINRASSAVAPVRFSQPGYSANSCFPPPSAQARSAGNLTVSSEIPKSGWFAPKAGAFSSNSQGFPVISGPSPSRNPFFASGYASQVLYNVPVSQSDFVEDEAEADLLAAMDAFDAFSQKQQGAPPVQAGITTGNPMTDDDDEFLGMVDLDQIDDAQEQPMPQNFEALAVEEDDLMGTDVVPTSGDGVSIQRMVVSSSNRPNNASATHLRAPHNVLKGVAPPIFLRQQTIEEVAPEPINILDDLPANTQVPSNIVPLPGFDVNSGLTWLYPTNYAVRDYQYNIVQKALFRNTLVCLPTGLGKTFIAAVVMFNFYRWYPEGKIVFLAPTKPLVTQQMKACYSIMGIPQSDMVEMTGSISPERRLSLWNSKRVFFMTPQTAVNDLDNDAFRASDVKCLVIDEAHRATGAYAYCEIVRLIAQRNRQFRVLALSATPGNDSTAIQVVLTNLLIAHLEIRQDDSIDIRQYTHKRSIERVLVNLDPLMKSVCDQLFRIIMAYVERLKRNKAVPSFIDSTNITKYGMIMFQREFGTTCAKNSIQGFHKQNTITIFMTLISLLHSYELLQFYGLRPFYSYIHDSFRGEKSKNGLGRNELNKNGDFQNLLGRVKEVLEEDLSAVAVDGRLETSFLNPDRPYIFGHPKLKVLEEIVLKHFQQPGRNIVNQAAATSAPTGPDDSFDSRIMIFTSFRDSVQEITSMLKRHEPLVRVMKFVGQAGQVTNQRKKGLTQKEQTEVIDRFRNGSCNVLVSTSVGEEGLDIGEVDLIICFDAQKSPLRSIQRTGRTGRKRQGKCIMLITEGSEDQKYKKCQSNKGSFQKYLQSNDYKMYGENPRMVPDALRPVCVKLKLDLPVYEEALSVGLGVKKKKSSRGDIQIWLGKKATTKETAKFEHKYLSDAELMEYNRYCKVSTEELPPVPENKFISNPLNFHQLCQLFRNGKSVGEEMASQRGVALLSLTHYPAFQILQQNSVFFRHSTKSLNFVTAMTQLSELSMAEETAPACDAALLRLYTKAARAGYMDLDGATDDASSSSSEEKSPEPTPLHNWLPKKLKKKISRPGRLSSLSTPQDDGQSQKPPPGGAPSAPSNTTSALKVIHEIEEAWKEVDESSEILGEGFDDGEVTGRNSKSITLPDVICSPTTSPDDLYRENMYDTATEADYDMNIAPNLIQEMEYVEETKNSEKATGDGEEGYSNLGVENWETWNDEMPAAVNVVIDPVGGLSLNSAGEEDGGELLADASNSGLVLPFSKRDATMLNFSGAMSFVNRSDVAPVIPETPMLPRKTQRRTIGSVVRTGMLDFDGEPGDVNMDLAWPHQPFGNRLGLSAGQRTDCTLHIDETLPRVPLQPGPQSHSTPMRDRTTRRLLVTPDVSPVAQPFEPSSSPSCIPDSMADEEEENEIPCSIPEEEDLRDREEDIVEESADFNGTGPFQIPPAALLIKFPIAPTRPAEMAIVAPSSLHIPQFLSHGNSVVECSRSNFSPEKPQSSRQACLTPTDDSEIVFRGRRRVRAVAAFETPSTGDPKSVRKMNTSSSLLGNPFKPPFRVRPPPDRIQKADKSPLEFFQDPKKGKRPAANGRIKPLEFLDDEAEVSDDFDCSSDEVDEDEANPDAYPSSLIASQSVDEDPSYMDAIYAQHNVRSPDIHEVMQRLGPRKFRNTNIFSQEFQQDSDYGHDSFVAYSEEDEEEESPVASRKRPAAAQKSPKAAKGWRHDFQPPRRKFAKN